MFKTIEFLQRDYLLVSAGPDERRRFLDIACSLLIPGYYQTLLKYNRALRQRNQQIKFDLLENRQQRDLWNEPLVQAGLVLVQARSRILEKLGRATQARIAKMIRVPLGLELKYLTQVKIQAGEPIAEDYRQKLEKTRKREDIFKATMVGPHRDNFQFLNKEKDMRQYASQGQIRMAVLSLKLALIDLLRIEQEACPILLFDDSFIEIDRENSQLILESLSSYNQIFFTSTVVPEIEFFKNRQANSFLELRQDDQN